MKSTRVIFLTLMVFSCLNALGQQKPKHGKVTEAADTSAAQKSEERAYSYVEQMPVYPGGDIAMKKFIKAKFGDATIEKPGIEPTRVFVSFTVMETGLIAEPKILRAAHLKQASPELEAQVLEFLKSMPKWIPGRQNGKPTPVTYNYPFVFWIEAK
jgi:periplasmic protein TonB